MWAPAKTPEVIIKRLIHEMMRALDLPEAKEPLFNAAVEVVGSSPEQFASCIKPYIAIMGKVIKNAGIRVDKLEGVNSPPAHAP